MGMKTLRTPSFEGWATKRIVFKLEGLMNKEDVNRYLATALRKGAISFCLGTQALDRLRCATDQVIQRRRTLTRTLMNQIHMEALGQRMSCTNVRPNLK